MFELDDMAGNLAVLLYTYARAGNVDKARAGLGDLLERVERRYTCPYEVATVYVALDDRETAMSWFEKAYDARADCWIWGKVDPRMDEMRKDDGYVDLLRRIGLVLD